MLWHKTVWMTLIFEFREISHEPGMTTHLFSFFPFQEHFYDAASSTGYISGVWKQSRGRFVEDLHCHQIAQLTFLQGAQISKGLLMLKGSLMVMLAKRPCLCSTIPQTIPWFFQKMRETFQHRQKLVNDPGRSVDILSSFPRFLDTKGLVSLGWDV